MRGTGAAIRDLSEPQRKEVKRQTARHRSANGVPDLHFPLLKEADPNGPAVKRSKTCVLESCSILADLLAWSTHLATATCTEVHTEGEEEEPVKEPSTESEKCKIIRHQASVIEQFIQNAKRQDERMDELEAKLDESWTFIKNKRREEDENASKSTKHRKQLLLTHSVWFEWYALPPRLWSAHGEK